MSDGIYYDDDDAAADDDRASGRHSLVRWSSPPKSQKLFLSQAELYVLFLIIRNNNQVFCFQRRGSSSSCGQMTP